MTDDQLEAPEDARAVPVTVARLDAVVALARLLATGAETDPAVRLADLETRRADLDAEIERTRTGRVTPLTAAEVLDLRALVGETAEGLRAVPAVADALLSPARRHAVAGLLARIGMPGAHHAWLAGTPTAEAPAPVTAEQDPPWDGVDDAPELGEDPGTPGTPATAVEPLADRIRDDLRHRPERPLADLLADRPLQGGLAELVAWLTLADDAVETRVGTDTDDVAWTDRDGRTRVATLPRVVFRRAGPSTPVRSTLAPTRETPR